MRKDVDGGPLAAGQDASKGGGGFVMSERLEEGGGEDGLGDVGLKEDEDGSMGEGGGMEEEGDE